jgi:hypothetical protein
MGDTPSWRQTADACCYSRALLATFIVLQRIGPDAGFVRLVLPAPLLFIYRLSFALRPNHPAGRNQPQARVKTESAIGNAAQHRLGVRIGYR